MTNINNNTYYHLDTGNSTVYFKVLSDTEIVCNDKKVIIPIDKFLDFIHTANELGLKAGKV